MDLVALDDPMRGGVLAVGEALMTANLPLPGAPNPRLMVPVEVCHFPFYRGTYRLNSPPPLPDPFKRGAAPV